MDDQPTQDRTIAQLTTGYSLRISDADQTLDIYAPDGRICVQLILAPEGPRIEINGTSLAIRTNNDLTVECDRFNLRATRGITITSGLDLELAAVGELRSEAFSQTHIALRGDVRLKANDDVQLDGERIRLNSPKQVEPR